MSSERTHLRDLVEEQHARSRQLDLPGLGLLRTSKGAALVSEQLRLQQVLRKRRAIERDEWTGLPTRGAVNEAGDDFLPGARLAGEQHGRVRGGYLSGGLQDPLPLFRRTHDALVARARVELARERAHARFQSLRAGLCFGDLPSRVGQLLVRDRERHVVRDPPRDADIARIERTNTRGPEAQPEPLVPSLPPDEQKRSESGGSRPIPERSSTGARASVAILSQCGPTGLDPPRSAAQLHS
jgi:hypothetical protein